MVELRQFVPQEACLSCQGCCRYPDKETPWAPFFLFEEVVELTERNLVPCCLFSSTTPSSAAKIILVRHDNMYICPCFDDNTNRCKIYAHRPLECRLYPFLLVSREGKPFLAVDENCPYVEKKINTGMFKEHISYFKDFFTSAKLRRLAGNNLTGYPLDYPQDLKILTPLS